MLSVDSGPDEKKSCAAQSDPSKHRRGGFPTTPSVPGRTSSGLCCLSILHQSLYFSRVATPYLVMDFLQPERWIVSTSCTSYRRPLGVTSSLLLLCKVPTLWTFHHGIECEFAFFAPTKLHRNVPSEICCHEGLVNCCAYCLSRASVKRGMLLLVYFQCSGTVQSQTQDVRQPVPCFHESGLGFPWISQCRMVKSIGPQRVFLPIFSCSLHITSQGYTPLSEPRLM